MASSTMVPTTTPLLFQQQQAQQQQQQSLCQCQCQDQLQAPQTLASRNGSTTLLSQSTDQFLPVRFLPPCPSSYFASSHAYNLRSSSTSKSFRSNHDCLSSLSPSTNACIPTFDYSSSSLSSSSPPLSPPFGLDLDNPVNDALFPPKDNTLNHPQQNALGVDFSQTVYNSNNHGISNSFENWLATHHYPHSISNPIESLLNKDISTKQFATSTNESIEIVSNNDGQSISNAIDNTVYQQLQGFSLKKNHLSNKIMSSSPQTPRDGQALLSSFGPSSTFGGAGMNKSAADFDFDMLAASFLNDQVTAFDSLSAQPPAVQNKTESFFANLPLVGSPMAFNGNLNSTSPPLQNAFRNFSPANSMLDAASISIPHQPMPTRNNSTSSSASADSVTLASPAFDASSNFPFSFNSNNLGNGSSLQYNSPNFSGVDTPALVADDGNDLAASLTTSPMWGQLDLGSISLFPQQQQIAQEKASTAPLQQLPSLPTVSPQELSLPLPEKNFNQQVRPASVAVANKSNNKKRVRESPAFGDDDEENSNNGDADVQQQQKNKKARRSVSASVAPAGQFNGTRHTSTAPLPLDAPTQARTYHGPESKTSKRAVPAAAARKVAAIKAQAEMFKRARRSVSIVDADGKEQNANVEENEDDEIEGEFKQAIEMSIEAKRRQNTIAARRSRARKADHLASLENSIKELTERVSLLENEKMVWMMRAMAAGWTEDSRSA